MKKIVCLLLIVSITLSTSCKKENTESNEIKASEMPEAVLTNEEVAEVDTSKTSLNAIKKDSIAPVKTTEITFDKVEHDFGIIKQGASVDYNFKFENTGTNDLIITGAKGSCGCTVPDYPKQPVKPGEKGKIKVSFNTAGKSGKQTKTVTVNANTASGTEKLTIKANIIIQ